MSDLEHQNIYYDMSKLLSFNKFLNISIGARGLGKSYAAKRWAINNWLKNKKQFVYIRRYKTEFNNIKNEQPTTETSTFVNWDSDIAIRDIPDVGTGSATVLVTFDKPLSDVTYEHIYVQEFGAGKGKKTDVVVNNNTVQFTDDDISTHDFYVFQLINKGQHVGQTAWDDGIIPNKIKFTLSDGSITEFNITHN